MSKGFRQIVVLLTVIVLAASQSIVIPDDVNKLELAASSSPAKQLEIAKAYLSFKTKFAKEKKWKPKVEDGLAQLTFQQNYNLVEEHNKNSTKTHKIAINLFSDIPKKLFINTYLRLNVPKNITKVKLLSSTDFTRLEEGYQAITGSNVDWTKKITPIKHQGACGSCWAFAAIAVVESSLWIKSKSKKANNLDLSEQELVDCSVDYGGCNGGWTGSAIEYIKSNGINDETKYPYKGENQDCKMQNGPYKVKGTICFDGCDSLALAIRKSPLAVAIDASNWSDYSSGIFSDCDTSINHGVLLMGATKSYWRIKNSWGTDWGEKGFIKLARGNTCDICSYPIIPAL